MRFASPSDHNNAVENLLTHRHGKHSRQRRPLDKLKSNYARNLASGVELPGWAAKSFSPSELAVLGAIRDVAYKAPSGTCSLTVSEIAELAEVDLRTAIRAITMAIAGGLIERDGGDLFNRHIHYKLG